MIIILRCFVISQAVHIFQVSPAVDGLEEYTVDQDNIYCLVSLGYRPHLLSYTVRVSTHQHEEERMAMELGSTNQDNTLSQYAVPHLSQAHSHPQMENRNQKQTRKQAPEVN